MADGKNGILESQSGARKTNKIEIKWDFADMIRLDW